MSPSRIVTASRDEAELVAAELRSFNRRQHRALQFEPVWLVAQDPDGAVVGGFVGEVYLGWLEVEILWVAEACRGKGLGSRLLRKGEEMALSMGARSAFLDTFSWQAEDFYIRQGYEPFGRLEDFPDGASRTFFRKRLTPM